MGGHFGRSPLGLLYTAAENQDLVSVRNLLEQDPSLLTEGRRLLHLAARLNYCDLARLILDEFGACIDGTDADGRTALLNACCRRSLDMLNFLLLRGADPTKRDAFGFDALMEASYREGASGIVNRLLKIPAVRATMDRVIHGRAALHRAAFSNIIPTVEILLLAGANPTLVDENEETPRMIANSRQYRECAELLKVSLIWNELHFCKCKQVELARSDFNQMPPPM